VQVPRSSKEITEDNDYILYRVILFRRVADTFKAACRQAGYQVPSRIPHFSQYSTPLGFGNGSVVDSCTWPPAYVQ